MRLKFWRTSKTNIPAFIAVLLFGWIVIRRAKNQSKLNALSAWTRKSESNLIAYHHAIDQLQWISDFAKNKSDLSTGKSPVIYYDRKRLYHPTDPNGCRYRCVFTNDTGQLGKGDIVVYSEQFSPEEARNLKRRGVLIVFESGECPYFMPRMLTSQLSEIEVFNTYLVSSPVPYMYPMFLRNEKRKMRFTDEEKAAMLAKSNTYLLPPYHHQRTKLIAWVVSNYKPSNYRIAYARAIKKFIPVDIYGRKSKWLPRGRDGFRWLSENYKFYLAFENSNCKYYITEKVTINALSFNMVPIVLGAYKEDYDAVLPPHSYINVDDYKSVYELVRHLLYLDKNDTAYAEYFAWKEHGKIFEPNRMDCRLCGFMYQVNEGKVKLEHPNFRHYADPQENCFERPLPPLR